MQLPKSKQTIQEFEKCIQTRELIIWGRSKQAYDVCERYDVKYIIDKNDELCDAKIGDVSIYLPCKLYSETSDKVVILICTSGRHSKEIVAEIQEIGDFTVFFWNVLSNGFFNSVSNGLYDNLSEIALVKQWLYDDLSKKIFQEVVNRRICGVSAQYSDLKVQNELQYLFTPALMSKTEGIILDAGGYTGDSVDRFVNFLKNDLTDIYTFEALPDNIAVLNAKKDSLKKYWNGRLKVFPYAVSDEKGEMSFAETEQKDSCFLPEFRTTANVISMVIIQHLIVETIKIDDVISSEEKIRYIKMDIEGAEYQALQGARQMIIRNKPGLAISIYHNPADYFRLAKLIKQYVPEYKLAVRHYKDRHVDTVLYAWI